MPRLFSFAAVTLAVASIAVSGCAAVSSTKMNAQDARFGGVGIPYLLPKALVPVGVVVSGTQVRVDLLEPVYVGDATQVYALRYDNNPFSTDTMTITVWEPPHRAVVRHTGKVVKGSGAFEVEAVAPGRSRGVWSEMFARFIDRRRRRARLLRRPLISGISLKHLLLFIHRCRILAA